MRRLCFKQVRYTGYLLAVWLSTSVAMAVPSQVTVDLTAGPIVPGPGFQYEFSLSNLGPDEVVLVDILNAPAGDPLIAGSLETPAGFLGIYDSGVLRVAFLGDTKVFEVGSSVGGFRFTSLASPGQHFTAFEALTVNGELSAGQVNLVSRAVPDTGGTLSLAGLGLLAVALLRRRVHTPKT